MKPTGFEEFFADAPVTPAAFEEEQSIYDRFVLLRVNIYIDRLLTDLQRHLVRNVS